MQAYSQDLRQRILDTVQRGDGCSARSLAGSWSASPSSLGCCDCTAVPVRSNPGPMAAGTRPYSGQKSWSNSGSWSDSSPMPRSRNCASGSVPRAASWPSRRALRKLGLPRKKKFPRAKEQDRPDVQEQRREFCGKLASVDPRRLVYIDESGANTAMTRT